MSLATLDSLVFTEHFSLDPRLSLSQSVGCGFSVHPVIATTLESDQTILCNFVKTGVTLVLGVLTTTKVLMQAVTTRGPDSSLSPV